MTEKHLNIISFTVPYPANYGGVIDVYYKLAALKKLGIKIHLHCFTYDREAAPELERLCESVNYYPRHTGLRYQLSNQPYIVYSRQSGSLLRNLLSNDYPILFEGLHTCYYLGHPGLKARKKIYRESNIEHHYYYHLSKAVSHPLKKLYFLAECFRLRVFQPKLAAAGLMLAVSTEDTDYLRKKFPGSDVRYLPSFHGHEKIESITGTGSYALYQGNLSVPENQQAAIFLAKNIFGESSIPLVVAGLNPSEYLRGLLKEKGIRLVENPSDEEMETLIRDAQVNILVTFQSTGLKLKLLNTLYHGRHVLVNAAMLKGTGLEKLCAQADTAADIRKKLGELANQPFTLEDIQLRQSILSENYSDTLNAAKLVQMIF